MYQFITKKTEQTLDFLTGHSWAEKEQDFFEALAEFLSRTLEVEYICIDKLHSDLEAETVAVYYDGHFEDNLKYTLADTPCGKVLSFKNNGHINQPTHTPDKQSALNDSTNGHGTINQTTDNPDKQGIINQTTDTPDKPGNFNDVCYFPENVKHLFPKDAFLQEMGAESYAGITLWNTKGKPVGLIAAISRKPFHDMLVAESVLKIVAIRAAAELEYRHTEKLFIALGKSSHAMLHAANEKILMDLVCDIFVKDCGYTFMWIGLKSEESEEESDQEFCKTFRNNSNKVISKRIIPVAKAGFEDGYLENFVVTWDDTPTGRGPTGTAIRTGKPVICHNMLTDPNFLPWRENALKRGYASSVAIPLRSAGNTLGAITFYAREPEYFEDSEVKFLVEMANNLANGITAIRLREEKEKAMHELEEAKENLEAVVEVRTYALKEANLQLQREILARKRSEIILQKTEEKYRTVADFTHDCESWLGPDGRFIYISPSFEKTTGYTVSEFMLDSSLYYNIAHPDDRAAVLSHFNEKLHPNHEPCQIEYRIITRDGQEKWMGHTCLPVFNNDGEWLGQRGSNRDITIQKKAELVMRESQKQLRALTQRLDEMVDEQSRRIAREIHDELGHLLTALKFEIDNLSENSNTTIGSMESEITHIHSLVENLINSVRKIATELRPDILDHLGLIPSLQWQVKQFSKRTKICCDFTMDEISYSFDSKQTIVIFRILQEILTNVARHSGAKHVRIYIIQNDNFFAMKVTDDGCGFRVSNEVKPNSLGLVGMHERALSIGGEITINSFPVPATVAAVGTAAKNPETGTSVTFRLPLKPTYHEIR